MKKVLILAGLLIMLAAPVTATQWQDPNGKSGESIAHYAVEICMLSAPGNRDIQRQALVSARIAIMAITAATGFQRQKKMCIYPGDHSLYGKSC